MMDGLQVDRLSACMDGLICITGLNQTIREMAEDVIGAGMEGAQEKGEGVVVFRADMEKKAHEIVESLGTTDILRWVAEDARAEKMIEEYVGVSGGWKGEGLIPLLRKCREYEIMRVVYAAMLSVKTVTIQ